MDKDSAKPSKKRVGGGGSGVLTNVKSTRDSALNDEQKMQLKEYNNKKCN